MQPRSALDRFLAEAAARPDAPAILEDGQVAETYASLARAALGIGAALRARGAGPEHMVGVAAPRSAALVAGMLGAWAAGAAWTVLDPALPGPRRAVQIDEGQVRWILTAGGQTASLPPGDRAPHLLAIADARRTAPLAEPARIQPGDLAYAYWTSGSTGQPKGVAVEHRGLPGMLAQQIAAIGLGPGQRSLLVLRASFDATLSDIGTALLSGACLCIESALDQGPMAPDALLALMHARRITYADLPPSLLAVLPPDRAPPDLRAVVIGGEPCPVEAVRAWARRVRLINAYGPTEATVCTSLGVCTGAWAEAWDRPLLGAPLDGVVYRVVDGALNEVPPGQPGQLAIGGVQLARGYIARPALEAARFVHIDGERFFLTGDRVVRAPDGAYVFLGRVDRQVKIRGQLVAPEELEAALAAHPDVARAQALTRTRAGRTVLIAAVAPRAPGPPDLAARLMAHVAAHLPSWMQPQRIEVMDALPETATGKVDAAALEAVVEARARAHVVPAPGRAASPDEHVIARAAAQVLDTPEVDLRQGLISLGGDSLTVIAMAAACASAGLTVSAGDLAADVPLRTLALGAGAGSGQPAAALDRAAALPADLAARLRALPPPAQGPPRAILLTGATGFLGARLLLDLGRRSPATLVCLVRADHQDHAWARLRAACDAHEPGALDALAPRVRPVCGDLTAPGLGLAPHARAALARDIDTVFHCAARVNLVEPLAALAPHNLGGTGEILRFCAEGAPKALHHASTLSVFVATDRVPGQVSEDDALDGDIPAGRTVFGGYAQSKWAAERLVRRAAGALPVAVYRLGLITGDPDRGALPRNDFLALLTRGLADLGAVPEAWLDALAVDITPVGFAAPALAAIALAPGTTGPADPRAARTFHIAGRRPVPLGAWIDAMRACGVDLVPVSEHAWRQRARDHGASPGDPGRAAAVLGLCRGQGGAAFHANRALDMFQATGVGFDSRRADAALAGAGIDRPGITPALLARYVRRILEDA